MLRTIRRHLPGHAEAAGLIVAGVAVAASFALHQVLPALSPLTICVILGVAVGNVAAGLSGPARPARPARDGGRAALSTAWARLRPGLRFAAKTLLRWGIVLLGLTLSIRDVLHLGAPGLGVVVTVVAITFFGTQLIGRAIGVPSGTRLLIATGFSICGASAVAAMDGVTHEREEDVVTAIALVTLCGSLAIAVLPLLRHPLGLSDTAFGMWTGASVHDVAQVVATASVVGPAALAPAVIVKLTRVVLLAPLVAGMSLWRRHQLAQDRNQSQSQSQAESQDQAETPHPIPTKRPPILPLFVIGFLLLVAVRSTEVLPDGALSGASLVEQVLLAAALFGLGTSVQLRTLFTTGGRALVLGLISWVLIAAVSYAGVILVEGSLAL